jgi:hypothetical protein
MATQIARRRAQQEDELKEEQEKYRAQEVYAIRAQNGSKTQSSPNSMQISSDQSID